MIANRGEKDTLLLRNIMLCGAGIIAIAVGAVSIFMSKEKNLEGRIYPNVYLDGVNIGGKTKEELKSRYDALNRKIAKDNLTIIYKQEPIATFDAKTIDLRSNGAEMIDRAYLVGRTPNQSTRIYQKITSLLKLASFSFDTEIRYNTSDITEFMNDTEEHYNKPAKNALFTFENGRVVTFRQEEKGLKINTDTLYKNIEKQLAKLKSRQQPVTVTLTDSVIEPEVTLSEANSFGIEELIAEGTSDYSGSIPSRIHNVILAASKFNGVLVPKDKVLSFVDIIGDISALTGYQPAYVIKNGKTVLGDGGGVCQISTTLFRAAMNAGLPIIERHAHAYRVHYYENDQPPGLDATIFSPTVDLKVKNDTPASILILTEVDEENNIVTFKLYGKKDGRSVEISKPVMSAQQPAPPPAYQDDPTLKKGIVKQVDWAAPGAKSIFTYKVTRGTETLIADTFVSVYRPWQAVYLVGQAD